MSNQSGTMPNFSTAMALIGMLRSWSLGTDGNGATIRTLLSDYCKAFDLVDHSILVRKLRNRCKLPASIINWIIDFYQTDPSGLNLHQSVLLNGAWSLPVYQRIPN